MLSVSFHDSDDPSRRYQILERVGAGSFGEVLRAVNTTNGQLVALKKVLLRKPDKGLPDNVLREIKLLQIVDHPNVVKLQEVFPQGASLMLAFEYCNTDLAQILRHYPHAMEHHVAKGILQQMLRGLAACHAERVLHRDLKPSNVLVEKGGVVKLADFGLARRDDKAGPYTHTVATRWYRAPELLYGARVYGTGVDMWAVGCIFAELLGKGPLIPGEHDIDQLYCVINLLGTPTEAKWPGMKDLPDYHKITFPEMTGTPLQEARHNVVSLARVCLQKCRRRTFLGRCIYTRGTRESS
ncbi:hypothetical protein CYMTET_48507 [Cymbomonas tetramitiformis]|uniref:cyclin-dependent kinase n=1 Tax=Cymbomonas tetramitiformis TaxID=36881 RepID=A0AAE0BS55_9CHLO|nr:hypothetical protein CYMTET_48507 [Cymbomonas tetramitiformis]